MVVSFIYISVDLVRCTNFLAIGDVAEEEARALYQSKLNDSDDAQLAKYVAGMRSSYAALPKNAAGVLGQPAVRHVLYRLFVQSYGWFIEGLEPHSEGALPAHIRGLLPTGSSGASLHELAAMAASLEELVHREAEKRLRQVLDVYKVDSSLMMSTKSMGDVLSTYLMVYLKAGNITASGRTSAEARKQVFGRRYAEWDKVKGWLQMKIDERVDLFTTHVHNVSTLISIVQDVDKSFHSYFALDCVKLKERLRSLEDKQPGLVPLSTFYNQSLVNHWNFNEKLDYLRSLGAVEESNPKRSNLISANYVTSRSNCQHVSHMYNLCCRDDCESILAEVERKVGASTTYPDEILSIVSSLSPYGTSAISEDLRVRLRSAASANGKVPIHGRLFAQWMHNVFPRECPYPHQKGTVSLHTAEEWTLKMGHESSQATDEEVSQIVAADTCRVDDDCGMSDVKMLPWSTHEELLETADNEEIDASGDDEVASCWPVVLSMVVSVASVVDCAKPSLRNPSSRTRCALMSFGVVVLVCVAFTTGLLNWTSAMVVVCYCVARAMMNRMGFMFFNVKRKSDRTSEMKCCV